MTGRSIISGLQSAFVIDESPAGNSEEIWPDKYGRVRVRFHWDRDAKYACWLRVVQPWAGKQWGHQWIPRVGDEVAVSFFEGDPDLPVIVGSMYNADNMPMFTLPDNKTQSGIHTHSTPGGGSSNYNMLRFEDKIGNEEIYKQAEKDLNTLVKNNETRTVKNNRTSTIHVNDTRTVETGDDTIVVQQPRMLQDFLKHWYASMKDAYWYDRHKKRITDGFFGYWAFEAVGVVKAFGIDDSTFRDMPYYPKDLLVSS